MKKTGRSGGWAAGACMCALAWSALAAGCGPDAEPGPQGGAEAEGAVDSGGAAVSGGVASAEGSERSARAAGRGAGAFPDGSATAPELATPETGTVAVAGSPPADDESPPSPVRVLPGERLAATADWEVSAERHRAGDPLSATVAEDYAPAGGPVLISQGTKLLGRVKVAEPAQGPGETPFLEVGFETLSAPDYERPVETLVVETGPGPGQAAAQPGTIAEGAVLVVEIRRILQLPPPASAEATPDSSQAGAPSARPSR